MHLHSIFRHIGGWSACKLAFLIALAWSPGLQATPPSFERMAVYELYFFPTKTQIFESSNKNTISTTTLNYGGPLGLWRINFFLKSIDLKVPNLIAPLRKLGPHLKTLWIRRKTKRLVWNLSHNTIITDSYTISGTNISPSNFTGDIISQNLPCSIYQKIKC